MLHQEQFENLIRKQLKGILSDSEKKQIESLLKDNDEFKKQYEFFIRENEILEQLGEYRTREQIRAIYKKEKTKFDVSKIRNLIIWILLGLVLLTILIFLARKKFSSKTDEFIPSPSIIVDSNFENNLNKPDTPAIDNEIITVNKDTFILKKKEEPAKKENPSEMETFAEIAMNMYELPADIGDLRSESSQSDLLQNAWKLLRQGKIVESEKLCDSIQVYTNLTAWILLKAHIQFKNKKYTAATKYLVQIPPGDIHSDEVQWYLILARLATKIKENQSLALSDLNKILTDSGHPFNDNALKLRDMLKLKK